jgi:subtilisin family serine protease
MSSRRFEVHRGARARTALFAVLGCCLVAVPLSAAGGGAAAGARGPGAPPELRKVTLITGDVVRASTDASGRHAIALEPNPDGTMPRVAVSDTGTHLYVVPESAVPLLAAGRLDRDLFDVAGLIRQRYDDARSRTLPVIVDYGRGAAAATESRQARLAAAEKTVTVAALGAAAFAADKARARAFWRSLTSAEGASGAPSALADGAARVDLDGRVRATIDPGVAQIRAPQAWAAGYDGTGTTVAVLDTGYDTTHPDLKGVVTTTANFSTNETVADGNGHGTHVASTIAGTGAASSGAHGGVAPGAELLVGKVLDDSGMGEDSAVLAGMQWAVAQGADVVNMSLGGEASDGQDPLSRAVEELSASSDTLFVIAAGNTGWMGPSTVTSPAAADAALTVGAVDGSDVMAYFSSRGPRLGDRAVKPDVSAPGVGIVAARAAGTSLGAPEDDYYTSLEGTSMATPHVAGLAAILKHRHPAWDGERLKAAITASTVPVPGATAFDTGTGRVDAERAIAQTVISSGSLNLGWFPFPQSSLPTTHTPLTYTNLGSAPVTLALAAEGVDGGAAPAGVTVSPSTLTVPAGGSAQVDVALDPTAAGVGSFSGVITADAGGSEQTRTAFGFGLESEHYDLAVEIVPRAGTQRATHVLALRNVATGDYEQRELVGPGTQTVSFRVPPGTYGVAAFTSGLAADEGVEGVLAFDPAVHVGAATKVVLDGDATKAFRAVTDRPVAGDAANLMVEWNGPEGFSGFIVGGAYDRLYASPFSSTATAEVNSTLTWLLSQPDAELSPPGGAPLPLRSVGAAGQSTYDVLVPALNGAFPVVDAGRADALRSAGTRRAVALVAGTCGDLADAADALAAAGAAAMVAYPGEAAGCAGTLSRSAPLPVFQARPFDAARLLDSAARSARLTTHPQTQYVYDLVGWWPDRVPDGAVLDGTDRRTARFVEQYDTLGGTSADGHRVWENPLGFPPGRDIAAWGLMRPVAVPSTVTHYVSALARWERTVEIRDTAGFPEAMLYAPRRTVRAGETVQDRWFGGPIASSVSPLLAAFGDWHAYPYREGDFLFMNMATFTDDAGHWGYPIYLEEFEGRFYQDGELVAQGDDPLFMQYWAPEEAHRYRLVYATHRTNGFWQRSTSTETAWAFTSERPGADHQVLPLISIDYDLPLSERATAPAGSPFSFGLRLGVPPEVEAASLARMTVDISWDGGATWAAADLRGCSVIGTRTGAGPCTVRVVNRSAGTASLRVTAEDTAGRSVSQTIVDAYAVE